MPHSPVIALSINGGIKTLGAYAGLAAVVAFCLLVLLYFAQARELKRVREWVERELQRPRAAVPARTPAAQAAPAPPPAPTVAAQGAPPVATSVEGVRRVPIPPAAAAGATVVLPATAVSESATDATSVSQAATDAAAPADVAVVAGPPRLVVERVPGQEPGTTHELGGRTLIGRGKAASIRLSDPLASGRHARISVGDDGVTLEDLGSTNGTFVNGAQIAGPATLSNGDRIRVGESEFRFEREPPPAPQEPPPAGGEAPQQDASDATVPQPEPDASQQDADADANGGPPAPGSETAAVAEIVAERAVATAGGSATAAATAPGDGPAVVGGAAIPLRAATIVERTVELDGASAQQELPSRFPPAPAPHRDSPGLGGPPAPITRRPHALPADGATDERSSSLRDARRLSSLRLGARLLLVSLAVVVLAVVALAAVVLTRGSS